MCGIKCWQITISVIIKKNEILQFSLEVNWLLKECVSNSTQQMVIEHLLSDRLALVVFLTKKTTVTCLSLWMAKTRSLGPSHYVPGLLQCQRTAPLNVYVLILDDKTRDAQVTQLAERRAGNQSRASLLPGLSVSSSLATASWFTYNLVWEVH